MQSGVSLLMKFTITVGSVQARILHCIHLKCKVCIGMDFDIHTIQDQTTSVFESGTQKLEPSALAFLYGDRW